MLKHWLYVLETGFQDVLEHPYSKHKIQETLGLNRGKYICLQAVFRSVYKQDVPEGHCALAAQKYMAECPG